MATRDDGTGAGSKGAGDDPVEGDGAAPRGPWRDRVVFAPGGGFAYRPGELIVRAHHTQTVLERIAARAEATDAERLEIEQRESVSGRFVRLAGVPDPLETVAVLRREDGIAAQVNHVLFATACGCPPHPASAEAAWSYPESADPDGVGASPYYANPYYANPYYANAVAGGGCCCCCGGGMAGNPYYANPYYANPYYANPYYANADASPFANPSARSTGRRRSSARPAKPPEGHDDERDPVGDGVRIAILDTGWAVPAHAPVDHPTIDPQGLDAPDEAGDGFLDPAAGHGTFIAGLIDQLVPGCDLEVVRVLSTYGDGDEDGVADALDRLAERPADRRPHLVNLSFGGYSPLGMDRLADPIRTLHDAGVAVVASAGNDGTCAPMYPAVLPEVVAVGALDADGDAAPFTNYGPWVRACALGADLVSWFFLGFDGAEPPVEGLDPDRFDGWAIWSGTSFAAPRVVAALAREVAGGASPHDAVADLVDGDGLERRPMLGTVVPTG